MPQYGFRKPLNAFFKAFNPFGNAPQNTGVHTYRNNKPVFLKRIKNLPVTDDRTSSSRTPQVQFNGNARTKITAPVKPQFSLKPNEVYLHWSGSEGALDGVTTAQSVGSDITATTTPNGSLATKVGLNGRIVLNSPNLPRSTPYWIMMFLKVERGDPNSNGAIFISWGGDGARTNNVGSLSYNYLANTIILDNTTGENGILVFNSPNPTIDESWGEIQIFINGSNSKLFINGTEIGISSESGLGDLPLQNPIEIGLETPETSKSPVFIAEVAIARETGNWSTYANDKYLN